MDGRMGEPGGVRAGDRRLTVSQRRRETHRPVDGARRRAGGTAASSASEHDPLDQVDRDREGSRRREGGTREGPRGGSLQTDQQPPVLHDCHEFVFHFTPGGHTPLDRHAIGVRYQDPSNVGRWQNAAAGVRCRENTWFIPYETIHNREKDRPHPATFPPACPRCASSFTA